MQRQVVVLDRDGTIIIDRHYLANPAAVEFAPGAEQGLRQLHDMGCRLIVVTNQSGIGRGMFSVEQLNDVHERLHGLVASLGVSLEAIYYCPHAPEERCACRKPGIALMTRAAQELAFDPRTAVVIGDKDTDVEFGSRVGATTVLIESGDGCCNVRPDFCVSTLSEAASLVANGLAPRQRTDAAARWRT